MARKPATLSLASNIEPKFAAPLDGRMKVDTLADLTDPNSFPYAYVGLWCYVVSAQKWYTLRYDDPTNISSWVEGTTGADGRDGLDVSVDSVSKVGRENTVTFVWKDPDGSDKTRDLTILDGPQGERGEPGIQGPKGEDGRSFSISAQYASEEAMREAHPTGEPGDAYLVETEEDTPDLWYWNEDESDWVNYGKLAGAKGDKGDKGDTGFSPTITVADNGTGIYKLRITNKEGSFVTPNLRGLDGNHAPQATIDDSTEPVQSGAIKTALDAKQDKILSTPVGVRNYTTNNVVDQTTVQTTLEALAAAVNYMNIPAQLVPQVATENDLPANAKPGSICFVGEEGETPVVYINQNDGTWQKAGGTNDDKFVEITDNEVDEIWSEIVSEQGGDNPDPTDPSESGGSSGSDPVQEPSMQLKTNKVVDAPGAANSNDSQRLASFNGELHFIAPEQENNVWVMNHYILNGSQWTKKNTLPKTGSFDLIVYNNELYAIGGDISASNFYKWNSVNDSWSKVGNMPYIYALGDAVVYDGAIHIMGSNKSSENTKHYKWNGTSWSSVGTLPFSSYNSRADVYDNKIYSSTNNTVNNKIYTYDGTSWTQVNVDWTVSGETNFVTLGDKLYALYSQNTNKTKCRVYDGVEWSEEFEYSFAYDGGSPATVHDNKIYFINTSNELYVAEL